MRLTPRLLASAVDLSTAVARLHRYSFFSMHGVLAHSPLSTPMELL